MRDAKTKELLARGLAELVKNTPPHRSQSSAAPAAAAPEQPAVAEKAWLAAAADKDVVQISMRTLKIIGISAAAFIVILAFIFIFKGKKKKRFLERLRQSWRYDCMRNIEKSPS